MSPIIIIILILCILLILGLLVHLIGRKTKKGGIGNWSSEQRSTVYDKIVTIFISNPNIMQQMYKTMGCQIYQTTNIMHCLVKALEKTLTFDNANTNILQYINADPSNTFMNSDTVIKCFSDNCPGIPAKIVWTTDQIQQLATAVTKILSQQTITPTTTCVQCVVNQITSNFSPVDAIVTTFLSNQTMINFSAFKTVTVKCGELCSWTSDKINQLYNAIGTALMDPADSCIQCIIAQITFNLYPNDTNVIAFLANPNANTLIPFNNYILNCNTCPV